MDVINERKKRFLVNGVQFSMPRLIKDSVFYDTKKIVSGTWVSRAIVRLFRRRKGFLFKDSSGQVLFCRLRVPAKKNRLVQNLKIVHRPLEIYRQALARERERNYQDFVGKLRKNRSLDYEPSCRVALQKFCISEARSMEERERVEQKQYLKHLKKQKYG